MQRLSLTIILGCGVLMILFSFLLSSSWNAYEHSAQVISLTAVVPGCGNGIIEEGEECDASELLGASCEKKGYINGTLSCTRSCLYNVTACTKGSSGGGGGGRSVKPPSSLNNAAQVIVSGYAYARGLVTILKNSQIVATGTAGVNGDFQIAVNGLAAGNHAISVYSTDVQGAQSAAVVFQTTLTKGVVNKVDTVFIPPTLRSDKSQVKPAESIIFSGQATPSSVIEITFGRSVVTTQVGVDGVYSKSVMITGLPLGVYTAQAKTIRGLQRSFVSTALSVTIGTATIFTPVTKGCSIVGDLNNDCRVNLVDFSILAFWYQRVLSPEITIREKEHLSGDGKINIIDFSIMAFHWTG